LLPRKRFAQPADARLMVPSESADWGGTGHCAAALSDAMMDCTTGIL